MDASAAPAPGAGVLDASNLHPPWRDDLDDVALTGNEGADVDMTRLIAVDEEELLDEEEELGVSPSQESIETMKLLLSGGVAGAVSKTTTAPLARLTILYQVGGFPTSYVGPHTASTVSVGSALRSVIQREGWRALWKGNGVTILHRLPYSAANFYAYETLNEMWKEHIPAQGPLAFGDVTRRLFAGGTAGLTACVIAYPLDLVRTRLAAQTTQLYYRGIAHAVSTIVREEGVRGLYRGLGATLLQVGPSLAINYAVYETARSSWLAQTDRTTPTVGISLTCGSLAGLASSTATFPLDLVRRRLQLRGQHGRGPIKGPNGRGPTYLSTFGNIVRTEGLRGLYAGLFPEYYKVIPGVAIAFCTYEVMKKALDVRTNATNR